MHMKNVILIVDDSKLNRETLSRILDSRYKVVEAENGAVALKRLRKRPDEVILIILDIVMPVMDGFAFMEEIKKDENLKKIPIVVTTTENDFETERKCLSFGVWDFIPKTFHPEIIRFRVMNTIKRSRLHSLEHDPLTGLYNAQKFCQSTKEMLDMHPNMKFTLIRIDIERFKMVNNFYGTQEGDRLIIYLADVVEKLAGDIKHCRFGRMGGDVFAVCLPTASPQIRTFGVMVRERLKQYHADYYLETATGIYDIQNNNMDMRRILDCAALAAAQCKGQYMVHEAKYTAKMGESFVRKQSIINEMDHALETGEFVVHYQPKYELQHYSPSGAEALVRWQKADGTTVSPGEFIPIFEANGFITKLDYYVWESVCRFIRERLSHHGKMDPISVNVSRVNLYNSKFIESLINLVEKYKVPPEYLHLELTESVFSDDSRIIQNAVDYLHKAGFTILMDDFGSGYSSLNVLKDINLDVLKIDMRFLSKGAHDERGRKILEAVVKMAKSLDMLVIAEGVEEEKQVKMLKKLGCDYIQGFYFAKPMPKEDYIRLLRRSREKYVQ